MPLTLIRRTALAILFAVFSAQAQNAPSASPPSSYAPTEFQEGKDTVWLPTPQAVVDKMLDMAKVTPADFVIDLGSGDGRTVIAAARRGARALGVEYNPDLVELSRRNAEQAGVAGTASFIKADIFATDLSMASVITLFLPSEVILKLRPKLLDLKPGTRIVSNYFTLGDWQADETFKVTAEAGCTSSWCTALLWIVPARVAGTYKTPHGELTLKQAFQNLSGTLTSSGRTYALEGKVRGEDISFTVQGRNYAARLNGNNLELR